jgi:hypothetical protein
MRKISGGVYLAVGLLVVGCGSVSDNHPMPSLVPGGGVGGGKISGYLNVYVTDDDTRVPIMGAAVRVGLSADPMPCQGLTDSTGLAVFNPQSCPSLKGPATVTASDGGYAPSTLIGVDGANLTVTLRAFTPAPVDTATVSGTIAGWAGLTPPATGHTTIALIAASQAPDLGDRGNNITQPMRTVATIAGTTSIPADACVRNVAAQIDDCNWQLVARTGSQAHYAIIADDDANGTPDDMSDDVVTVIGWALDTGLNLTAGQTVVNETLTMVAAGDLQPFTASFATPPAGMGFVAAYPAINLGDAGRIAIVFPALGLSLATTKVPKIGAASTSGLAGATYDLIAAVQATKDVNEPSSLSWSHAVDVTKTVAVATWLPPPTAITDTAGTYAFTPVTGATLHSAEIKNPDGTRAWSVTIFDGSTSFTLPGVTPDPLVSGTDTLTVSALQIPGIDLTNVAFDDAQQVLTGLSSDQITFTH